MGTRMGAKTKKNEDATEGPNPLTKIPFESKNDHERVNNWAKRIPNGDQNGCARDKKGAKMVPSGNQNGTKTDPKWSWDLKVALPRKIPILGPFLDAFLGGALVPKSV